MWFAVTNVPALLKAEKTFSAFGSKTKISHGRKCSLQCCQLVYLYTRFHKSGIFFGRFGRWNYGLVYVLKFGIFLCLLVVFFLRLVYFRNSILLICWRLLESSLIAGLPNKSFLRIWAMQFYIFGNTTSGDFFCTTCQWGKSSIIFFFWSNVICELWRMDWLVYSFEC